MPVALDLLSPAPATGGSALPSSPVTTASAAAGMSFGRALADARRATPPTDTAGSCEGRTPAAKAEAATPAGVQPAGRPDREAGAEAVADPAEAAVEGTDTADARLAGAFTDAGEPVDDDAPGKDDPLSDGPDTANDPRTRAAAEALVELGLIPPPPPPAVAEAPAATIATGEHDCDPLARRVLPTLTRMAGAVPVAPSGNLPDSGAGATAADEGITGASVAGEASPPSVAAPMTHARVAAAGALRTLSTVAVPDAQVVGDTVAVTAGAATAGAAAAVAVQTVGAALPTGAAASMPDVRASEGAKPATVAVPMVGMPATAVAQSAATALASADQTSSAVAVGAVAAPIATPVSTPSAGTAAAHIDAQPAASVASMPAAAALAGTAAADGATALPAPAPGTDARSADGSVPVAAPAPGVAGGKAPLPAGETAPTETPATLTAGFVPAAAVAAARAPAVAGNKTPLPAGEAAQDESAVTPPQPAPSAAAQPLPGPVSVAARADRPAPATDIAGPLPMPTDPQDTGATPITELSPAAHRRSAAAGDPSAPPATSPGLVAPALAAAGSSVQTAPMAATGLTEAPVAEAAPVDAVQAPSTAGNVPATAAPVLADAGQTAAGVRGATASDAQAVPAPQAPLPLANPRAWAPLLGQHLMHLVQTGDTQATVRVNPPQLGPVELRLELKDTLTHVSFYAHDAQVREALEQSLPRLRELLGAQGLQLGQSHVGDQAQQQQPRQDGGAMAGFGDQRGSHREQRPADAGATVTAGEMAAVLPVRDLLGGVDQYV